MSRVHTGSQGKPILLVATALAIAFLAPALALSAQRAAAAGDAFGPPAPTQAAPAEAAPTAPEDASSRAPGAELKWSWGNTA
jgi:hypothetical protein